MTDIEIYDRAIYEYLSTISENVVYSITSKAFQNIAKDTTYADAIEYSMISFYRNPSFIIDTERYNFSAAAFGDFVRLQSIGGNREARYVKNLPVNLTYQVDIWSAKEKNVQETAVELISKLFLNNQVVVAPMNPDGEDARFHITNVEWTDNSDLEVENERGRLYRHTITFTIDARLKLTEDSATGEFTCCGAISVDIYNENT